MKVWSKSIRNGEQNVHPPPENTATFDDYLN